jgi:hypothetical protein
MSRAAMGFRRLVACVLAILTFGELQAAPREPIVQSLDIQALAAPTTVRVGGRTHLVYERGPDNCYEFCSIQGEGVHRVV